MSRGGGGGAVVLEGGYDFQNHLKEGGTFLFPILSGGGGVHFSPTCVFQEWSGRRFRLFYI